MKFKKYIFLPLILILSAAAAPAQELYTAGNASISFFSRSTLGEIEGSSDKVSTDFDLLTGDISISVPVRSIVFDKAIIQQFFNEKYLESDRFPYAYFKGIIKEPVDPAKNGNYKVSIIGKLTVHGVSRAREIKGVIRVNEEGLLLTTGFVIHGLDHNIKSSVKSNLSGNTAEVSVRAQMRGTQDMRKQKKAA